jgi:hypothetical protein
MNARDDRMIQRLAHRDAREAVLANSFVSLDNSMLLTSEVRKQIAALVRREPTFEDLERYCRSFRIAMEIWRPQPAFC